MNNILRQILVGLAVLALTACGGSSSSNTKVQDNGLTKGINDLVPEDILEEMISLGMPIHRGGKPPKIEGIYKVRPLILLASNIASDPIGQRFADLHIDFHKQNNKKLTIKINYQSSRTSSGYGIGSFIVGQDNKFTIFSRIDDLTEGQKSISVQVYSGIITDDGIEDYYQALFMVDDKGDSKNILIDNGDGRVGYDNDGVSEKVDSLDFKLVRNQKNTLLESLYRDISSSKVIRNP